MNKSDKIMIFVGFILTVVATYFFTILTLPQKVEPPKKVMRTRITKPADVTVYNNGFYTVEWAEFDKKLMCIE